MNKKKRDVCFIVFDIWHHETKGNDDLFVKNNNTEVGVLQAFWQVNPCRGKEEQRIILWPREGHTKMRGFPDRSKHFKCGKCSICDLALESQSFCHPSDSPKYLNTGQVIKFIPVSIIYCITCPCQKPYVRLSLDQSRYASGSTNPAYEIELWKLLWSLILFQKTTIQRTSGFVWFIVIPPSFNHVDVVKTLQSTEGASIFRHESISSFGSFLEKKLIFIWFV